MDKSTDELNRILQDTHTVNAGSYLEEQQESLVTGDAPFADYMRALIKKKGIKQQTVFLLADIPERYGYKLLSEEKHTRQRDVILRICYAAGLTLTETQKALKLYQLPILYSRIPRDAMLMICFNERPGTVVEVNELLISQGQEPLRVSGNAEDGQGS